MNKKYYRLNPECYLIKGVKGGMIVNVYARKAISIDEKLSDVLFKLEHGQPIEEQHNNLGKLIEMGWANEYKVPVFIDKIRVTNAFGKRHMWKSAPVISLAVLQITGECDQHCLNCLSDRCPSCKKIESGKTMNLDNWKKIVDRLAIYDTKAILLTGGNPILNPDYEKILDYITLKKINIFIHVPSAKACDKIKDRYNIFFTVTDNKDIEKLGMLLRKKRNILKVFVNEKDASKVTIKDKRIHVINSDSLKIHKSNMFSSGIDPYRFVLKQMYNECFFSKICINQQGDILPCLGADVSVGNFLGEDYAEAFKRLIEDYWYISVDDRIQDYKCSRCENRYVCRNLCIFSQDRDQCSYDVEGVKWNC